MRNRTSLGVWISVRSSTLARRARALAVHRSSTGTVRSSQSHDETGSSLILALVFLVAVSLIVGGLLSWLGTSLNAAGVFSGERNMEYAATDAVNLAIQNTRYSFDPYSLLNAASPQSCLSPAYPVTDQQASIAVYCTMVWAPDDPNGYTRTITYSACVSGGSATACALDPILQAVVAFDDNPPGTVVPSINPSKCTPIADNGNCGESMTQLSWQWHPVVPVVNSISTVPPTNPPSGPPTGGTTVQINGTGFAAGETVGFLQESGGIPVSGNNGYNPPVPAALVSSPPPTCALPTCIEVTSPNVLSGVTYFVTVTTSGGTSAFSAVFTITQVTPVVAGLYGAVTGGSVTGGNTVTIEGTGFWAPSGSPAQVFFCPTTGGGSCIASPSNKNSGVVISQPQSGSIYDTMTAESPELMNPSAVGTYYVQVEVDNEFSAFSNQAAPGSGLSAPVFTYTVLVPIVTSVTPAPPTAVAVGGSITINGFNFVNGVTVGFCPVTGMAPYYSPSCVGPGEGGQSQTTDFTIVSTTEITVTVPSTLAAGTYYPIVAVPPYTGSNQPEDPYAESSDEFRLFLETALLE